MPMNLLVMFIFSVVFAPLDDSDAGAALMADGEGKRYSCVPDSTMLRSYGGVRDRQTDPWKPVWWRGCITLSVHFISPTNIRVSVVVILNRLPSSDEM